MFKNFSWRAVYRLTVPQHWVIPTCSVLLGTAIAFNFNGTFDLLLFILNVLCALMCLCSVNVLNNYRDYRSGNDTEENCALHPEDNPILSFGISLKLALFIGGCCLFLAAVFGGIIVYFTSFSVIWFAVIAAITILGYTLAPIPFSALPVGEILSGFVEGAILGMASYFIQTGEIHILDFVYYLPVVIGIASIMFANNSSDIEKDLAVNRHTLPTFLKPKGRKIGLIILIWGGAFSVILLGILVFPGKYLSVFPMIPLVIRLIFLTKKIIPVSIEAKNRNICMPTVIILHKWLALDYLLIIIVDTLVNYFWI